MKQSNIILGIGILVAVILIISLFFLKSNPEEPQSAKGQITPTSVLVKSVNIVTSIPFRALSEKLTKHQ